MRRCHVSWHWGVQLILAYSWARPAILVAGKGREVMFLFLLFLHFHSCSSFFPVLFHLFCYLFSFLPFSGRRHKMTHKGWRVVKPQHNQSKSQKLLLLCFCWLYAPAIWRMMERAYSVTPVRPSVCVHVRDSVKFFRLGHPCRTHF